MDGWAYYCPARICTQAREKFNAEQGNTLTTRIDPKTKLILADLSSAVIVSERPAWERCLDSTGFAGLAPETVNGRVAMVAIMLVMGVEVVTQKSLFAQVGLQYAHEILKSCLCNLHCFQLRFCTVHRRG